MLLLFESLAGLGVGALIASIFDDGGDEKKGQKMGLRERAESRALETQIYNELSGYTYNREDGAELEQVKREIFNRYQANPTAAIQEASRVGQILYSTTYDASAAELNDAISKYGPQRHVDDTVSQNKFRIYDSIDSADDGDSEISDSFSFETEVEIQFGPEQMAASEEDIAPESDIQDYDITEPSDEISQQEEIDLREEVSPEDEISVVEETIPFEPMIYSDVSDLDMNPVDDFDETLSPVEQYDLSDSVVDEIQWVEQELDSFSDELEANIFEAESATFYQDTSQEMLTGDDTYQDIGEAMNVIDLEDYLDTVSAIPTELVSDHMNVPFFEWLDQPPGGEAMDTNPF